MDLDDAYHVERALARGAGGTTELVTLGGSGPFVRKRIPSKLARRGVWGTLAECDCARLPKVVASYEMPSEFVVVCDFVPGENLEDLVASRGRLAEKDARQIVAQLCEAAGALHAHGIVHRDISPRNVIVAADGAHLIDLGIARFRTEGATHDTTQLGTPGFASPEQHGFAQTDARSDVYSLGRVLGYLLTGVMPGVPAVDEYERALDDEKAVGSAARAIVRRASALEPSARYQSAAELARALDGEAVAAAPTHAPEYAPGTSSAASGAPTDEEIHAMASAAADRWAKERQRPSIAKVALCIAMLISVIGLVAVLVIRSLGGAADSGAGSGSDAGASDDGFFSTLLPDGLDSQGGKDDADGSGSGSGSGGSSGAQPTTAPSADENPLEIVEFGWHADSSGYICYAFGLRNNADVLIEYPGVTLTGRDADGAVLFSDEWVVSEVAAGETAYFASIAGNGTAPATVDIVPIAPDGYQYASTAEPRAVFSVSGAREVPDGLGGIQFVGEVTTEKDDDSAGMGQVILTLVLRNESGEIIYGCSDFASRPAVGETTSFEILSSGAPTDYATFEIYARPW